MPYFAAKEFLNFPSPSSLLQSYLLSNILNLLNTVRASLNTPMVITSCYRDRAEYQNMIARGLHPSATSDHFWGDPVKCHPIEQARYGEYFIFSVGAVDVKFKNMPTASAFREIVAMQKAGLVDFGQVIFEKTGASEWVHLSNPRTLVFSPGVLNRVGAVKQRFLTSYNGGITYQPYKGE